MKNNIKAIDIRLIHRGQYLSYYEIDYLDLETQEVKTYEMVSKSGSIYNNSDILTLESINSDAEAVVLIVFDESHDKMLLPLEFRLGVNNWVINNIAGLIETGESIEEAAIRELKEETGLNLYKIVDILHASYTCAPVTDDKTILIICEAKGNLTGSVSRFEDIRCKWYTRQEIAALLQDKKHAFAGRTQAIAYMWMNGGVI